MADLIDRDSAIKKFIESDGDDDFTTGYNFAVDEYRQKLSEIPSVNRWISCNEKFPEDGRDVIIYIAERWIETPIQIAHIQHDGILWELSDGEFCFSKDEVSHWMPLPETPEITSN